MLHIVIPYAIALLLIVLGFVALLTQRTYVDPATAQPIEVDIPLIGKMKANYPALVFVFLGCGIALYTLVHSLPPRKMSWDIRGNLMSENPIDWSKGILTLTPTDVEQPSVNANGAFEIGAYIEEGKDLEEVFETLTYTHDKASAVIYLGDELKSYEAGKTSVVEGAGDHSRQYTVTPQWFPSE